MNAADSRSIFITGMGIVAAPGTGGREVAAGARGELVKDAPPRPAGGEEHLDNFDPPALLGKKGLRHLTRGTLALMSAARLAMDDAGLEGRDGPGPGEIGVVAGTCTANAELVMDFDRATLAGGPQAVNPALFPQTVWNSPSSQVAIRFGLEGLNMTVATGWNSGLDALIRAISCFGSGCERIILAGGFEELTASFRLLAPIEPGRPESTLPLSEGAALLVLESGDPHAARGVRPLARIWAGKSSYLPRKAAEAEGLSSHRAELIEQTLATAGCEPARVDRIWHLDFRPEHIREKSGEQRPFRLWDHHRPAVIDLVPSIACSGGLTGALAAAIAAAPGESAPSIELLLSEDGAGRTATLLLERNP